MSGIFKRVGNLANTIIDETEVIAGESLGACGSIARVIGNTTKEFAVESKDELITVIVKTARNKAQHRTELAELGFTDEAIEKLLQ